MEQNFHKRVFADIPIFQYETVDSTQEIAQVWIDSNLENLKGNSPDFSEFSILAVISANHQTIGKGRRGRVWNSEPQSSLLCSYIVKANTSNPWINVAMLNTAYCTALQNMGVPVKIKWPNDFILVTGEKIGGCLTEVSGATLKVGIGVNINNNAYPAELRRKASSIEETGVEFDSREFLDSMLKIYLDFEKIDSDQHVFKLYKDNLITLGKHVKVETINGEKFGIAVDVKSTGTLVIETDNETKVEVTEGDVVHLKQD